MYTGSVMKVADNSGARFVRIIKVLRKSSFSMAKVGDFLVASVIRINPSKKVKKGQILRVMVLRSAFALSRKDGHQLRFQRGAIVVVDKKGNPRSTKIHGPVPKELREAGYIRLVSLGSIAL